LRPWQIVAGDEPEKWVARVLQRIFSMNGTVLELLILAGFAAFILYRLYAVLGRRTGNEQPPVDLNRRERVDARRPTAPVGKEDNVVPLPRGRDAPRPGSEIKIPAGTPLAAGVDALRQVDPSFEPDGFVRGAKVAHEMIARAFAQGDRSTLKPLLSEDVYASFDAAITSREKGGHQLDVSFIGLKQANLEEVSLRGRIAEVTVRFVSELISVTRDAAGAVIEGAAGVVREVTDVWTFARDTRSSDPNWKLVSTAGAA
jgi:predicted lipid-binding transport protein (Tim44 family)